jgi:hypothetical protein
MKRISVQGPMDGIDVIGLPVASGWAGRQACLCTSSCVMKNKSL